MAMLKDELNLFVKALNLTKYLIDNPQDGQTLFHICESISPNIESTVKLFKKMENNIKKIRSIKNVNNN